MHDLTHTDAQTELKNITNDVVGNLTEQLVHSVQSSDEEVCYRGVNLTLPVALGEFVKCGMVGRGKLVNSAPGNGLRCALGI